MKKVLDCSSKLSYLYSCICSHKHPSALSSGLFLLLTLFQSIVYANELSDEQEFNKLMLLLEQQTTLATKTQLNADYVPGMVSLMSGDEMRDRGFETLWDALAYIPGVQKNISATGKRSVIVRGVGKTTETSKIKILLNDIAVNASSSATAGTIFDTPVTQIEKIEFIRGPGSAIHGEFALMGVLNVITRKQGKSVTAGVDTSNRSHLHALYDFGNAEDLVNGSLNIAVSDSEGEDLYVARDKTPVNIDGYAPGLINNKHDSISAILGLGISDINISLQYQQSNRGDHFGVINYLPPQTKQTVISDTMTTFNLSQNFLISEKLKGQWSFTHLDNTTEKNQQFLAVAPIFGGFVDQDDIVSDVHLEEHRNTLKANLQYELEAHDLYAEVMFSRIDIKQSSLAINLDSNTLLPDTQMNAFDAPVQQGLDRTISSLVVQDEYAINDSTTLTAGLRYDEFEDLGDNTSPRLALVWILSNEHIVKFQYAEAYRPPTLRETGGALNSAVKPETIDTTELSYIYSGHDLLVKNTIYYSTLKDFIEFQDTAPFGYRNVRGAKLSGYELEIDKTFNPQLSLSSSLSLQNSENEITGEELFGSTPVIFNLSSNYRFNNKSSLIFQVNSLSGQERQVGDNRQDISTTSQIDIIYNQNDVFNQDGLTFNAGIRNIFEEEIRYLASENTYPDDYFVTSDATFWMALTYHSN